jgi:hypothetical protein
MLRVRVLPVGVRIEFVGNSLTESIGGDNPIAPEISAVARAGSNVTMQWSNVIRMHNGPIVNVS